MVLYPRLHLWAFGLAPQVEPFAVAYQGLRSTGRGTVRLIREGRGNGRNDFFVFEMF